jgi:hypothetical protein
MPHHHCTLEGLEKLGFVNRFVNRKAGIRVDTVTGQKERTRAVLA